MQNRQWIIPIRERKKPNQTPSHVGETSGHYRSFKISSQKLKGTETSLKPHPAHTSFLFQIYFQSCSLVLQKTKLEAKAATREPALISLPDRR